MARSTLSPLHFLPPRCPYSACLNFARPSPGFFLHWGSYLPLCRPRPIPRFRCRGCRRTFSRQSFRADRRLHKPDVNARLWMDLVSGVSLRQAARKQGLSKGTVADRLDRFGLHGLRLSRNLARRGPPPGCVQLDEMESFEHNRLLKPLTLALLVEPQTHYMLAFEVGRLRSRGSASPRSERRRREFEARYGRRPNESAKVVGACLRRLRGGEGKVVLTTDEKPLYGSLVRRLFPEGELEHRTVSGKLPKSPSNPLFPANHAAAMARYGMSRLIRRSFCTTKDRRRLRLHGAIWAVWRNARRWRTNRSPQTPAMARGILSRRLTVNELFGWRQDMGRHSIPVEAAG